jgi:virginiamycin B lyase
MHSIRFITSSILTSLVVAGCASHCALTPSIPGPQNGNQSIPHASQSVRPMVVQSGGSSRWLAIQNCCGSYGAMTSVASGFFDNVWLPSTALASILRISFNESLTPYSIPVGMDAVYDTMSTGPDGDMWYATAGQPFELASLDPQTGTVTEYPIEDGEDEITSTIGGPDGPGGSLWYTNYNLSDENGYTSKVGLFSPENGDAEAQLPSHGRADSVAYTEDGYAWVLDAVGTSTPMIYRVDNHLNLTAYPLSAISSDHSAIVLGDDGNLWFALGTAEIVGKMTEHGQVTDYMLNCQPSRLAAASDGVYFVCFDNQIGSVSPSGKINYIKGPTAGAELEGIAYASDGNLWVNGCMMNTCDSLWVYLRQLMTVTPTTLTYESVGQILPISVTEKFYPKNQWTAVSSDPSIVSVAQGHSAGSFIATAKGSGNCTITVADKVGNAVVVPATVP